MVSRSQVPAVSQKASNTFSNEMLSVVRALAESRFKSGLQRPAHIVKLQMSKCSKFVSLALMLITLVSTKIDNLTEDHLPSDES